MTPSVSPSGPSLSADETSGAGAGCKLTPGLHIVATPIGNAADITLRALDTLRRADAIVCEDTRVTSKLLTRHGIHRPLLSYHEHNAAKMRPILLERVRNGEALAVVTDAGTPLVSDPGFKLVREAAAEGLNVTALPGPSALLTALVLSGLPSDRFLFIGFPPTKTKARRATLAEFKTLSATIILYETAPRLLDTLIDLNEVLGPRDAAVARELTKLFEEVRRGPLPDLVAHYAEADPPKGEIVIVVGPPPDGEGATDDETVDDMLRAALARGLRVREAVVEVVAATGRHRREVYARALALNTGGDFDE